MKQALRSLLLSWTCLELLGCAAVGPPLPPSLELPHPPTDVRAARKGSEVTLTWTMPRRTTDRRTLRYLGQTQICRSLEAVMKECGKPIGNVAPPGDFEALRSGGKKESAHFIDKLPEEMQRERPNGFITYAVEVLNHAGRGDGLSNEVRVPLVPTVLPFNDFSARMTAQGVLLHWQCPAKDEVVDDVKYLFRIYRSLNSSIAETRIAEMDATGCVAGAKSPEEDKFLDQSFDWEKTYFYRGTVVSVVQVKDRRSIEVEGDDTPKVGVFAQDVFPPAVPTGLQAVFSGPGQAAFVDLVWAPDTDADLAGYNVYRRSGSGPIRKLNSELVKTPAFRDTEVVGGNVYSYSVSAVDERGNESGRSAEGSEKVP